MFIFLTLFCLVNSYISLDEGIEKLITNLTSMRRDFHQYPEVGFNLNRTSGKLREYLAGLGKLSFVAKSGVILDITGTSMNYKGKQTRFTLALRSDMDALPMTEENPDLPWQSKNVGAAHMCGHDGHMTCLTGAAYLVSLMKSKIPSSTTIRFFFQPAEEGPSPGGALPMIAAGVLENVNEVYGMHYSTPAPFGIIFTTPGPFYAHYTGFKITVIGKGGHSSEPDQTIDPILTASSIVLEVNTIVSRNLPPGSPAVISICKFHSGEVENVIPERAILEGSIRDFSQNDFEIIKEHMEMIVTNVGNSFGANCSIEWEDGYPVLVNSPQETENVLRVAQKNNFSTATGDRIKASEDFSYYLLKKPGNFFVIGGGVNGSHRVPNHSSEFDFNDEVIPLCVKMWVRLIEDRIGVALYA